MPKKQTSNTPAKRKSSNGAQHAATRGVKATIGYTLRTVPRNTWDRFRQRLDKEGRTVNWALNQFIEQYGNNDDKIVLSAD